MKQAILNTTVLAVALVSTFYVLTELLLLLAAHHGPLPLSAALAAFAALAAYAAVLLPVAFYRAVRHEDGGK